MVNAFIKTSKSWKSATKGKTTSTSPIRHFASYGERWRRSAAEFITVQILGPGRSKKVRNPEWPVKRIGTKYQISLSPIASAGFTLNNVSSKIMNPNELARALMAIEGNMSHIIWRLHILYDGYLYMILNFSQFVVWTMGNISWLVH